MYVDLDEGGGMAGQVKYSLVSIERPLLIDRLIASSRILWRHTPLGRLDPEGVFGGIDADVG